MLIITYTPAEAMTVATVLSVLVTLGWAAWVCVAFVRSRRGTRQRAEANE